MGDEPKGLPWNSTVRRAPTWRMGTELRPPVGTSKTYQGKEFAAANDSPIGGLSPGPMYYPKGRYNGNIGPESTAAPKYSFGIVVPPLKASGASPGPANYEKAAASALGKQRINSDLTSPSIWTMGTSTRQNRENVFIHKAHGANITTRTLLGGTSSYSRPERAGEPGAGTSAASLPMAEPAAAIPARVNMGRALTVAMTAGKPQSEDPMLTAALIVLKSRVRQIDARQKPGAL